MSLNERLQRESQERIVAVAKEMLAGKLGVIEGSRMLVRLRSKVSGDGRDPDFDTFVAIDSETDHLPIGAERRHWAADALVKKDASIKRAEDLYREDALVACRKLLQRLWAREKVTNPRSIASDSQSSSL